jgi:predicted nuclease of predicted toxin-antitoxin system
MLFSYFRIYIWFFIFIFPTSIFSGIIQTYIMNDMWVPIGVNSIAERTVLNQVWNDSTNLVITDIADEKSTYIISSDVDYGYNLATGIASTINLVINDTVFLNSTMSIFAIKNVVAINGVKLDGATTKAVHIKLLESHRKKDIPSYVMYIQGQSKKPAVKIVYQSDYE